MECPWLWCPWWRPARGPGCSPTAGRLRSRTASVASPLPTLRADLARLRLAHGHPAAFRQVHHRVEDDLVARLDAAVHFHFGAEVARNGDLLQMRDAILDHRDMQAVLIE